MPTRPQSHRPVQARDYTFDRWKPRPDHHRLYSSSMWRRLRMQALHRDAFICRVCGVPVGHSGNVDHVKPHRGDWALFADLDNLQTLCQSCHSAKTARGE